MSEPEEYKPKCPCGAVLVEVADGFHVCEDPKYPHVWKGYVETYPGGFKQLINADRDAIPLALELLKRKKIATEKAGRYPALAEALAVEDYDYEGRFYCETAEGSHNERDRIYRSPEEAIERAKKLSFDDDAWAVFQIGRHVDEEKGFEARPVAIVYGQKVFIWNGEDA